MACVGTDHFACGQAKLAQPHGDKHLRIVVFTELVVDPLQDFLGRQAQVGCTLDKGLGDHHEHGCGNALAGHIRHHHNQVVVIHQEEVVEVAAYLLGWVHGCKDIKFLPLRIGRENAGQHSPLNVSCHIQLCTDSLLFCGDGGQVLDVPLNVRLHVGNGLRQNADLIVVAHAADLSAGLDTVTYKPICFLRNFLNGGNDLSAQDHGIHSKEAGSDHRCCNQRVADIGVSGLIQCRHRNFHA